MPFSDSRIFHGIASNLIRIILGLALMLAGCTNPAAQSTGRTQTANDKVVESAPSWARLYDLESLVREADLIIEGTIAGIRETRNVGGAIYTDYRLDVSRAIKAPFGFADRSIILVQNGGTYQGTTQVMQENGLYQLGAKVLLFLRDITDNPVHSPSRERKYMVLMPGGRFHIMQDGTLDTPTTRLAVADNYRGKGKSELEKDILARLPSRSDYLQQAVQASFLIVEGKVAQVQETRLIAEEVTPEEVAQAKARGELAGSIYTFYAFTVDKVLEDKIARYKDYPRKTSKYDRPPVVEGQVITVVEIGGTYQGISQRRTWSQFLQPGDRMVLFLNAIACEAGIPVCTKTEQQTHRLLYILEDNADRFLIGPDNRLTAVTRLPIGQFYNGQLKGRLEQDIRAEQAKWEKALEEQKRQPTPTPFPFPLPPTPTPSP